MKILFVGGTGNISSACAARALDLGHEVFFLNRGNRPERTPAGVETVRADIRDAAAADKALGGRRFDAVADFTAFVAAHVETAYALFRQRTAQYVFISSASAYRKPPNSWMISEATDLWNPYWQYARDKIACEAFLMERHRKDGFPVTIVRPSHTYSDGMLPSSFGSGGFTVAARMLAGQAVIVHGDGSSLWTITHAEDFAPAFVDLLGNPRALGEVFHITSEEALTWDQIHRTVGYALGVEPKIVHIPSDFIAEAAPARGAELLGDKTYSAVFDNSKIRRLAPNYGQRVPFSAGIRRSAAWYERHPDRKVRDPKIDAEIETILKAWNA